MTSSLRKTEQDMLDRRQFMKRAAGLCAGAAGAAGVSWIASSDAPVRHAAEKIYTLPTFGAEGTIHPRLAIVHGADPVTMVKAAVDRMGGITRFIKPGEKVVIKPNVAWDRLPEQAANTNPLVVAAVVQLVMEARPSSVVVTDVSLNDPLRCFDRSGIRQAAEQAGAKVWIPGANDFRSANLDGELLKVWPVSRAFLEADRVINIPMVKHHSLCGSSLAQKNWYGILGGRRNQLHQNIHTSIADLAGAMRPTLTVMDATRSLMANGPTGGSLNDVKVFDTIIAGTDEVAIDSYSMGLLGADPATVEFMEMSQKRGLGVIDWRSAGFVEFSV
ncbi:MAG: DUF362 domain-containing protein [Nitrospinota bacterium]|nr:DUF362 domain-containing protein [Nitrospinota bacterium]